MAEWKLLPPPSMPRMPLCGGLISDGQAGPVLVRELVNMEGDTGFAVREEGRLGVREGVSLTSQAACNPFENKRL